MCRIATSICSRAMSRLSLLATTRKRKSGCWRAKSGKRGPSHSEASGTVVVIDGPCRRPSPPRSSRRSASTLHRQRDQAVTRQGQLEGPVYSREERRAELFFERFYFMADGRLCDAQFLCRPRKAQIARRGAKSAQQFSDRRGVRCSFIRRPMTGAPAFQRTPAACQLLSKVLNAASITHSEADRVFRGEPAQPQRSVLPRLLARRPSRQCICKRMVRSSPA